MKIILLSLAQKAPIKTIILTKIKRYYTTSITYPTGNNNNNNNKRKMKKLSNNHINHKKQKTNNELREPFNYDDINNLQDKE